MDMQYLDLSLPSAAENLALDEALLLAAEEHGEPEVLRFWECSGPVVVLGAGSKLAEDVDEESCRRDGVPILRRSSGGGTVLLDAGCLCFTLVLGMEGESALREVRTSFRFILDRVCACLRLGECEIRMAGTSDLVIGLRKLSGNSQQRKRRFLLHHGTLLHHLELARVPAYLRVPGRQPGYRRGRGHLEFLTNLPLDLGLFRTRMRQTWQAWDEMTDWPQRTASRLMKERYTASRWIFRR